MIDTVQRTRHVLYMKPIYRLRVHVLLLHSLPLGLMRLRIDFDIFLQLVVPICNHCLYDVQAEYVRVCVADDKQYYDLIRITTFLMGLGTSERMPQKRRNVQA